jgi:dTDP-4-dehydrorhamnose reductase
MHVLIFGSTGQLARELARAEWAAGAVLTFLGRDAADLSLPGTLGPLVEAHRPDIVIIAAAYTAVDKAEDDEALATTINAEAPAAIAEAASACSIPVVHLSTDYVFDGGKDGCYAETDTAAPINAYGRSKLAGEVAVAGANPKHLILRTSWIYSAHGVNFLRTTLRLAATRAEVSVVADQHGCPTSARDLAQAIAAACPRLLAADAPWGTYHLAGASSTTWHGFAEAIFTKLAARGRRRPRNDAIATSDYPTRAKRPLNSRLCSEGFADMFGLRLPGFETAMPHVLSEVLGAASPAETAKELQ